MHEQSKFIQPLEQRKLLSVSQDSAGWTVVKPSSDTRTIYVSSSGKDTNNGLSASSPIKTLSKAQGLIRDGKPDWILLKRGETFGSFFEWRKRGRSAQEPINISAYGSGERPKIRSGTNFGFITYSRGTSIDNIVMSSLDFFPEKYNGSNGNISLGGIRMLSKGSNIIIEDCKVAGYRENITLGANDATISNAKVRRCQILDANASKSVGNAQGLYISAKANGITIEENIIDHNGWKGANSNRNFFSHNIYVYNGAKNVTIKNNIITRAGFYGIKFNAGGTATNNFFARNSESIYLEGSATISSNVITEAITMPTKAWGVGINTQKAPSATIKGNLVTKIATTSSVGTAGIMLYSGGSFSGTVQENVIYNWRNGLKVSTPGKGSGSVKILDNRIEASNGTSAAEHWSKSSKSNFVYRGNDYYSTNSKMNKFVGALVTLAQWNSKTGESGAVYKKSSFPDAGRDIAKYASTHGGGSSFESFIAIARNMSKSNWKTGFLAPAVNTWFRQGFGMGGASVASVASAAAPSPFSKTAITSGSRGIGTDDLL